jgi:uncharacterized RDD family membrane protein YckC
MKNNLKTLWSGLLLAALIPLAPAVFAVDPAKPDATATPAPALQPQDSASQAAAQAPAPAAPSAPAAHETPLHEIVGGDSSATPAIAAPTAEPKAAVRHHRDDEDNRVSVGDATYVGPNDTVEGNAVAVMGPVTVDGTVNGNSVSVMGTNTINGTVRGNAVAVAGDLKLGPKARLDGNAVSIGGNVVKDPSAVIGGNVVQQLSAIGILDHETASSWWHHGLRMGRPFAFGPHLRLLWIANACLIAFYIILALLFPGGIRKCADTLEHRPGIVFLTGILAVLATPVLFILLLVTVVGIPVALVVLPLSIVACTLFGKAALYSFIGRAIVGKQAHPALALVIGVAIFIALCFIPVLGLMLWCLVSFLGFACALTTLFTSTRPARPAGTQQPAPAQAAAAPVAVVAPLSDSAPPPVQAPLSASVPPVVSAAAPLAPPPDSPAPEAGLPRAGFWIRMAALLIDAILVGIIFHMTILFMPAIAAYGAILWKLRGATIGGIIFGLKVVRADGKPMDWVTAAVRALACFLSLIVIGLGFLWIAFDPEKQGWHDKIAGTVVVRLQKAISLV